VRRALLAAVTALAVLAPPAAAGPGQESLFMDDDLLLHRGPRVAEETLRELAALGVDRVRVSLHWRAVARDHRSARRPRGDRYDAAALEPQARLVRLARREGIRVLMNPTGGAPLWATGRRNGRPVSLQYEPSPAEFARFVEFAARRLPGVEAWSLWNEPNQGALLQPQWRNGRPRSPHLYRALVRAGVRGLRRAGRAGDAILLGETAPRGDDRRGSRTNMRPGLFLRELLCLDEDLLADRSCSFGDQRLPVTGYAHHPYPVIDPPDAVRPHPEEIALADADRLTRLLDAASSLGRLPPELPLWWTEFGWQTRPPDPVRGIPLADQASWIVRAEQMSFRHRRVRAHAQFLLRDTERRPGQRTYQSGLRFNDGRRKPAYDAYRLGLTAPPRVPAGEPLRLWGLLRAAPREERQTIQIEVRGTGGFEPVGAPLEVDRQFDVEVPRRSGTYRVRWRGMVSNAVGVYVE
jgi:hypothetical protein